MGHRIFAGPFEALEYRLEEEVRRLQRSDPLTAVGVVVGSNVLAAYLKRRLAAGGRGFANIRFYTFIDLALRLAGPAVCDDARPRMPRLGPAQIVDGILSDGVPEVFRQVSAFAGFRDALLDTFRDLRDAGVTPAMLDSLGQPWALEAPDRTDHLAAFAGLYREFRSRAARFRDVDDDFRDAASGAPKASEVLGSRTLLVYGIYDVTGQQRDLLTRLKDALELAYFVPVVDDDVCGFALPFIEATAQATGAAVDRLTSSPPASDLGRLWGRQCGLRKQPPAHDPPGEAFVGDGTVSLVSAPGESRVAIEIIREIVKAVSDGIVSGFHQAAVILRHTEEDLPPLVEGLRLRGIPYYVQGGVPFVETRLAKAISSIASLSAGPFPREGILTAMELIAASLPAESGCEWDVAEWRLLTNDLRFLAGADSWDEGVGALVTELSGLLARASRAGVTADDGDARVPLPATVRCRLESAQRLQSAWKMLRAAADWPEALEWAEWAGFLERKLRPLLGASSEWALFADVLDQLSTLQEVSLRSGARRLVPRAKLIETLSASMADLAVPSGRFMRSGVNILSLSAARGLRFPLVIVPGLEEGRFPARLRQDPLLYDEERVRLGSGSVLPLRSQRLEEERLLFDMAARSAQGRLVLVTSRLDEGSDRERIPSDFFLRVAEVAAGRRIMLRELAQGSIPGFRSVSLEDPAPGADQPAVDRSEIRLRLIRSRSGMERGVLSELAAIESELLERAAAFDHARWQRRLTSYDGMIADPALLSWLRMNVGPISGPFSASRVEEYARCPYLFYLRRVQGLDAWEELEAAGCLDPMTRGSIVHRILEQFMRRFEGEGFGVVSGTTLKERLRAQAVESLDSVRPAGVPDLLWDVERDQILGMLDKWLEFELMRGDQGHVPHAAELPFGRFEDGERYPGPVIEAGRHRFVLRGVIDRVDLSMDGSRARVIDYKTGSLPGSMEKGKGTALMSGERVQLAVYRSALQAMRDLGRLHQVEGEFLHIQFSDGTVVPRSFEREEMERAAAKLPVILEVIGDGIEQGSFFARTSGALYGDRQCRHCDYARICGKDRQHREQRKSADPAVLRFSRMSEIDGLGGDEE